MRIFSPIFNPCKKFLAHIRRTTMQNRQGKVSLSVIFAWILSPYVRPSPDAAFGAGLVDDGSDNVRVFLVGLIQHMRVDVQGGCGFRVAQTLTDAYDVLTAFNEQGR